MAISSYLAFPPEWQVVRLGALASKVGSGATPTGGAESYLPTRTNFALIRSQNVFDRRFDEAGLAFISDGQAEKLRGVVVRPGDLLLNITGDGITFGRACLAPERVLPACVNQHVAIIRADPTLADPGYLLAFLTVPAVKSYIESFNAGGSRRAITKGHIETLEAMAATLFRAWFEEFALPPDAQGSERLDSARHEWRQVDLVQSELGETPAGWPVGRVDQLFVLQRGFDLPSASRRGGPYPVFAAGGYHGSHDEFMVEGPGVVTGRSGVLGNVYFTPKDFWPLNTVLWVKEFRHAGPMYTLHFLRGLDLQRLNAGSAVPTLNRNHVHGLPALLPPPHLLSRFEVVARALYDRINHCEAESEALARIRDLLLPKLISGELRIKDAEKMVEAAPV
jgi:type I restriction enzyme S subunit